MIVYGHYITDTAGNRRFFTEGCSYCRMSTGGQHEINCPCANLKVADEVKEYIFPETREELFLDPKLQAFYDKKGYTEQRLKEIRERSHIKYGEAWQKLAEM